MDSVIFFFSLSGVVGVRVALIHYGFQFSHYSSSVVGYAWAVGVREGVTAVLLRSGMNFGGYA